MSLQVLSREELEHLQLAPELMDEMQQFKQQGKLCLFTTDRTAVISDIVNQADPMFLSQLIEIYSLQYGNSPAAIYEATADDIEAVLAKHVLSKSANSGFEDKDAKKNLLRLIKVGVELGATDIHIYANFTGGSDICFRVHTKILSRRPITFSYEELKSMCSRAYDWEGSSNSSRNFTTETRGGTTFDVDIEQEIVDTMTREVRMTREVVRVRAERGPTCHSKSFKAVFRLFKMSKDQNLYDIGIRPRMVPLLIKQVCSPHGMIVISGPTGSGKTTFLHALLHHIPEGAAVETLEDPTEIIASYNKMISQTNLRPGETYEEVMTSLMRKDPDILVYGEMRDSMVIDACANAALTGHLILTTFHTNNSIGVLQRMVDMGQSPKDLAQETVLNTIIATRLAPILCPKCKLPMSSDPKYDQVYAHEQLSQHIDHIHVINNDGCDHCKFTGISGVSPIVEMIIVDDVAREFIHEANFDGLKDSLISRGWRTLPQQAIDKVLVGDLDPLDAHNIFGIFQSAEKNSFEYHDIY